MTDYPEPLEHATILGRTVTIVDSGEDIRSIPLLFDYLMAEENKENKVFNIRLTRIAWMYLQDDTESIGIINYNYREKLNERANTERNR